ncbi:MAG: isocitrate/isopropylmalate dehydrogenase family protein [Candidatus Brockarchaeota archaeon]|nr:isocitrate/isopropylmalate dehydrogenase family protein [Candidatus Brockarchaeota archaeon]
MRTYRIAAVPGDGIGPEVLAEGMKVLRAASEARGISVDFEVFPFGSERYLKTGETVSERDLQDLERFDAMYFGAIGDPRVPTGVLEKEILLKLRFHFDQYVNLRPVKLYEGVPCPLVGKTPKDVDFYVVRENTEDFYVGLGGRASQPAEYGLKVSSGLGRGTTYSLKVSSLADEQAFQLGVLTRRGCERAIRYAFELARRKRKTLVTSVDKANVMTHVYGLWREVFQRVSMDYRDIGTEFAFVDAISMWFVKNPEHYQVVVAPNMFGDIITDLGAMIQGGMGLAPGANINPEGLSMFEPIHGSAPKYKGLNVANPIASILAGKMMLEFLAERRGDPALSEAAALVESSVALVLSEGRVRTRDIGGSSSTSQVGDSVVQRISEIEKGRFEAP